MSLLDSTEFTQTEMEKERKERAVAGEKL